MRMRAPLVAVVLAGGLALTAGGATGFAAPASRPELAPRLLYSSDWTGPTEIFALDPSGRQALGQVTEAEPASCRRARLACGFAYPVPSPDGKRIAYLTTPDPFESSLWIASADGSAAHLVAAGLHPSVDGISAEVVRWSPGSKRIAFVAAGSDGRLTLHVAGANGMGDHVVGEHSGSGTITWSRDGRDVSVVPGLPSPDGRWNASWSSRAPTWVIDEISVSGPGGKTYRFRGRTVPAWSPDSRLLAFSTDRGISVADVATGKAQRLTRDRGFALAWSPDRLSLAYVQGTVDAHDNVDSGDIRTVTLGGRVSTLVRRDRSYGGTIASLAWVRPRASTNYRPPEPAPATRISSEGLLADHPIERLAADGDSVAYVSCGQVFEWSPRSPDPPRSVASLVASCDYDTYFTNYATYDLALATDRVVFGEFQAGNTRSWKLTGVVPSASSAYSLGSSYATNPGPLWSGAVGQAQGSGDLLAFSSWTETPAPGGCTTYPCPVVTTTQTVRRFDGTPCPCAAIRTEPGPLVPLDVDTGRILAVGDNSLVVMDRTGTELLTVGVKALAAALSGRDLVVLVRGELRQYDAVTAQLVRSWRLPDVPSGRDCDTPATFRCDEISGRLALEDTARGLVAHVLDRQVHLMRLSDGQDVIVGWGSFARFLNAGLAWADGSRIHVVPFDELPLR